MTNKGVFSNDGGWRQMSNSTTEGDPRRIKSSILDGGSLQKWTILRSQCLENASSSRIANSGFYDIKEWRVGRCCIPRMDSLSITTIRVKDQIIEWNDAVVLEG